LPGGRTGSAHFRKNRSGGISGNDRNGNDAPASGFNFFPADNLIAGPIAAFDENVGQQRGDGFARSEFLKNDDGVHAFEGSENFRALKFGQDRAAGAFQFADARVAVDTDDERVAKRARLFQALNVAGVQKVEAAVRKDDAATVAFLLAKPQNRFLDGQNSRMQVISRRTVARLREAGWKRYFSTRRRALALRRELTR